MLLCQHHGNLQPICDPQENIDWITTSHLYDNLAEIPSFIATHRQTFVRSSFTTTVQPSMLQQNQLKVYNYILHENDRMPIHMIVCGTAGTGKSYLINCLSSSCNISLMYVLLQA